MKRNILWMGMLAMVLAFGMAVVGCDDGSGGSGGDPTPQTVTYSGTANGTIYTLIITDNTAYVLTLTGTGGTKTSSGTVTVTGSTFTLKPSNATETFTASVSSGGISGFTGSITFDGDTTPTTLPTAVTPLLSGTYSMSKDGGTVSITFSGNAYTVTIVFGGETSPPFSGTYSLNGNTITFSEPDDGGAFTETATLSGDRNSLTVSGLEDGGEFLNGTYTKTIVTPKPPAGGSNPALKVTGAQVYTYDYDDEEYTAFAGTGTAMDVKVFILSPSDVSGYGSGHDLGKIGTISGNGKLTFELPPTIADDKLFPVPNEYGGNGKVGMVHLDVSDGAYRVVLQNDSGGVIIEYFDRAINVMGLSVKKGWNYFHVHGNDFTIISDISNFKWVFEEWGGGSGGDSGGIVDVPSKWRGEYASKPERGNITFTIGINSGTLIKDGTTSTISALDIKTGGTITFDGSNFDWVYLYTGNNKMGFMLDWGGQINVFIGKNLTQEIADFFTSEEGMTFTPAIVLSDIPESIQEFEVFRDY